MTQQNSDLRLAIAELVLTAGEGHIPSSYSIVDILDVLYADVLRYRIGDPHWDGRDFFVLSKGHGAAGLFVTMRKFGLLSHADLEKYGKLGGILGGHPDVTKVPHVEASTGSLGHGFPTAVGIALGLKIQQRSNRVFTLLGDGECHEGTVWESANIAANQGLTSLTAIIDWNQSASQLMPIDDLPGKWRAFGWQVVEIDGHDPDAIRDAVNHDNAGAGPVAVVAHTVKGKGVSFIEGHGPWHHKVPNTTEFELFRAELRPS